MVAAAFGAFADSIPEGSAKGRHPLAQGMFARFSDLSGGSLCGLLGARVFLFRVGANMGPTRRLALTRRNTQNQAAVTKTQQGGWVVTNRFAAHS